MDIATFQGDRKGTPVQYNERSVAAGYCTGVPLRSPWLFLFVKTSRKEAEQERQTS